MNAHDSLGDSIQTEHRIVSKTKNGVTFGLKGVIEIRKVGKCKFNMKELLHHHWFKTFEAKNVLVVTALQDVG